MVAGVALAAALPGITLADADGSSLRGCLLSFFLLAGVATAIWSTPRDPPGPPGTPARLPGSSWSWGSWA